MHRVVARQSISSDYTLTGDDKILNVSTSGGDVVITLPQISDIGSVYEGTIIHGTGGNSLTIDASGTDIINEGVTSLISIAQGDIFKIESIASGLWNVVKNRPTQTYRDRLQYNNNLSTVSAPVLMSGVVLTMEMLTESKLNRDATILQARLDSTDTWTDVSTGADIEETITNLLAWVDSNVSGTTQWEFRASVTYNASQDGESSIIVDYTL